jgi:cellulose synthase/poly-beta-1,6-N-acetylglucosamine synthase-like glycosyltransferase/peptidoglycan/xylan/chitin deacetylase (PgdA/CDA1 family)
MIDSSGAGALATSEVFFDPSGRRWRRVKLWIVIIGALVAALGAVSWRAVHAPPELAGRADPPPRPKLAGIGSAPFIGSGPLARLVRIERRHAGTVAVDALTGEPVAALTAADREATDGKNVAIYQYGYDVGVHRTIELTFDDGPDPRWTPRILDLLSRNKVPATFFVIGSEAVRHPQLVARAVREGHAIGNHTMTHPELTMSTIKQEMVTTDRILAATAGVRTSLARFPYDGYGPSGDDTDGELLLEAQRLGYLISIEDFDSNDWQYGDPTTRPRAPIRLPPTTMDNVTILLHDGGGNRAETLAYLKRLIPWAKARGYTFHSLPQVSNEVAERSARQPPNMWDRETLWTFQARWLLPNSLLRLLFWIAMVSVVAGGLTNVGIAAGRDLLGRRRVDPHRARRRAGPPAHPDLRPRAVHPPVDQRAPPVDQRAPPVTAVIAAYNEAAVIARCLTAVCASRYPGLVEILVIDDGSTDATADIVQAAAARDRRIRLIRRPNGGKPSALNRAFAEAGGEVVVTLDADTLLTPDTIDHLLRRFIEDDAHGRLGAVAGTVKVGNLRNLLTRWQGLEYLMQIGVDRSAQDALHAIMVVPGACAAWRREAVLSVGGYSSQTLAEDCDLALQLQAVGYRVVQSDRAQSFTEAPETFRDLSRQRFRWTFGNVQALWKHRSMMFNARYGLLGMFSMPMAALAVLLPVVFLPFVYVMTALTIQQQDASVLLVYGAIVLAVQYVQAVAGVALCRESPKHLLIVPIYRLIAEPLRAYLLYRSALTVLRGTQSGWLRVARTGTVRVRETAPVGVRT